MSTALATTSQDTNVLLHMGFAEGETIKPVNLSLIQPINASEEEGTIAGRFCDTQSNMQYTDMQIVVLEIRKGRVCFTPGSAPVKGQKPLCRSDNGLSPVNSDDIVKQDGGKGCARCPMSQWKSINGKKIKPICGETRTVLLAELSTGFPYRYNSKGTGVKPIDDLRDTISKFYLRTKAAGKAIMPYAMTFKMSSLRITGEFRYYIPKFSPPDVVPEAQVAEFADLFDRLVLRKGVNYDDADDVPTSAVDKILEGQYEEPSYEPVAA